MNKSGTLTTLQRQTADLQGQMIESLAEDSQDMTVTLEKAATVFEKSQTAQREAIASLSKTNEDLCAALIASESRNKQLEALLAAQKEAHEAKAALQAQTQKESCDRMFEPCEKISQFLSEIERTVDNHYLSMGRFFTRNEQGLWSTLGLFGPASRADCIAYFKSIQPFCVANLDRYDFGETLAQLAKNAAFEVKFLKIQMEALSGTKKQ